MVKVKDIAQALNLSQATVSRALRNDETLSIAPSTRAAILSTAQHMGYVAKEKADKKKSFRILVIHKQQTFRNQIDSSYYFSVRAGIESACSKKGIACSFVAIENIDGPLERPSGVIIVGNYLKEQYDKLQSILPDIPVSVVGITAYWNDNYDHITFSNKESVRLALEHLFLNGHSDIAYLGVEELPGSEEFGSRKLTYIELMQEKGTYNPKRLLTSDHGRDRVEQGYNLAKKMLKESSLPTAVFCANDPVALGVIKAFWEAGLRVPLDISIVSHDGCFPVEITTPPLTTIDVHPHELGIEAVHFLDHRMKNNVKYSRTLCLRPSRIERDSVKKIDK